MLTFRNSEPLKFTNQQQKVDIHSNSNSKGLNTLGQKANVKTKNVSGMFGIFSLICSSLIFFAFCRCEQSFKNPNLINTLIKLTFLATTLSLS